MTTTLRKKRQQLPQKKNTKVVLGKRPASKNSVSGGGSPNILNYRKLRVGAKILAVIKEVHEHDLLLSLPSLLTATMTFPKNSGNSLKKIYKVGEFVSAVIDGLERTEGERKRVSVSIAPEKVNEGLLVDEVTVGQVLMGRVASREEKGWLVDLGLLDKVPGFLSFTANAESNLIVGKMMMFVVREKNSRLISLGADVDEAVCRIPKLGMAERSLIPGTLFSVKDEPLDDLIKFAGDLKGRLDTLSSGNCSGGDSCLRLVYADPANNRYLLRLGKKLQMGLGEEFAIGDVIETAKVLQVDKAVGVKFALPSGCHGYAHLSKLSDERLEQGVPTQRFKPGSTHQVRILGYDVFSSLYSLTLRASDMEREIRSYGEVRIGQVVKGKVERVEEYGVLCRLKGDLKALIPRKHLDTTLNVGDKIKGVVINVQGKRVSLSLLPQLLSNSTSALLGYYEEAKVDEWYCGQVVSVKSFGAIVRFLGEVKALLPLAEMSEKYVKDPAEYVQEGLWLSVRIVRADVPNKKLICSLKPNNTNDETTNNDSKITNDEKTNDEKKTTNDEKRTSESKVEKCKDEKKGTEKIVVPSLAEFITEEQEEKEIAQQPQGAQNSKLVLKDVTDEYEKKLITGPNSSILWIEYLSVLLKLGDLEQARKIAERALQTISYRMEEERRNVWVAYLNLECFYGSKTSLGAVFERSIAQNEPLEMHMAMASILSSDPSKHPEAVELYERMCKKFKDVPKVWLSYATWLMQIGREGEARGLLPQSLKALPKREHIAVTQQFALLEYNKGENSERGRMLFEGIIASYPKRLDVWLVYLAREEKLVGQINNLAQIRSIYERLLSMRLSTKKAKCVFKQYLEFEKANGDVHTVEHVKQLARAFVEAKN